MYLRVGLFGENGTQRNSSSASGVVCPGYLVVASSQEDDPIWSIKEWCKSRKRFTFTHSAAISVIDFSCRATSPNNWCKVVTSIPHACLKLLPFKSSFFPSVPRFATWPLIPPVLYRLKTSSAAMNISLGKLARKNTQASSSAHTCKINLYVKSNKCVFYMKCGLFTDRP